MARPPRYCNATPCSSTRCIYLLVLLIGSLLSNHAIANPNEATWKADFEAHVLPLMKTHCLDCHRKDNAEGEFDIQQYADANTALKHIDSWERVVKRISLGEMPPEGNEPLQPDQKAKVQAWFDSRPKPNLCDELASEETQKWYRGTVMSRRLTRSEYRFAVEDLVGKVLPESISLPSDGSGGEGFDTNGDSLFLSPIHLEGYLRGADWAIQQLLAPDNSTEFVLANETSLDRDAANGIVERFARRAWRRPIAEDELERLMVLYDATLARAQDNSGSKQDHAAFQQAVAQPLKATLLSPNFLFVVERESDQGGVQRLTPHELAMRLALFIWSSIPDAELAALADSGENLDDVIVKAQVARMLSDPRASRLGENFGLQWLGLTDLQRKVQPDRELFPDFDPALVADMRQEAITFVSDIFQHDRRLLDLIDGDHVIVNPRLAAHYQLSQPDDSFPSSTDKTDASWQRLKVEDGRRGGVITLGAVLASTSHARRTSPVLRGQWILSEVLGSAVPPPPPNVPALEGVADDGKPRSLREQLEVHRDNPACASCHSRMDPLGFGLENFDTVGRWRTADGEFPIDASGQLPSGQTFSGPSELKKLIAQRDNDFRKHFVKKLLGFALGRSLNKFDDCVVTECLEQLKLHNDHAACLIETICLSHPFQHRFFKPPQPSE
ncbi:hypothetical protein Pla52o_52820 [Novipirellula galeiformis]|uniref:Planctomycete cytochrome C n=1 Tax=Novipirellula galeiformis TaxID=2528004 RepID=A0A5C6C187_9BACT|nr:DUF1592 domain-containing protein [Novipirellula galeiformis]TWU17276.1 hypothetical protein Pla52o_52820 [Novipirellula galeiformis]